MVATNRLGLNKQPVGDNVNTWGGILNEQGLELIDEAFGTETIALTGDTLLTATNFVSNQARNASLIFTNGGLSAAPIITFPGKEKTWKIVNRTGFALSLTVSGSTPLSLPIGRSADLICDGAALTLLEPVAQAAVVTQAIADQAAASASQAAGSATAASISADLALQRANTAISARDSAVAARDTTIGYRDAAAASATQAANSAAGVNLPAVSASDAGKALVVRPDGSGYSPQAIAQAPIYPIAITSPAAGATVTATQTFTAAATGYSGDTTAFYSLYGFPQASRTLNVYQTGTPNVIFKSQTVTGAGNSVTANLQSLGLSVSTQYLAEIVLTDVLGSTQRTGKQTFTTPANYRPAIGDAYGGGFYGGDVMRSGVSMAAVVSSKSAGQTQSNWDNGVTFANNLVTGGKDDWVMGDEPTMDVLMANLRPSTTSVNAFKTSGAEAFATDVAHWSSTTSGSNAVVFRFADGTKGSVDKNAASTVYTRAVRYEA